MIDPGLVLGPGQKRTFMHLPMMLASILGALMGGLGLTSMVQNFPYINPNEPLKYLLIGGLFLLVGFFVVFSLANLRTRLTLDHQGLTAYSPFRSRRIAWDEVTAWEAQSKPRAWLIRAWLDDEPVVVLQCHVFMATWVGTTITAQAHETPPANAPRIIRKAYASIQANWNPAD